MQNRAQESKIFENEPQQLSSNLKALLEMRNITANQVAQVLGMPLMTIRRLISGETADPRISTLKLLTDHFNISIDALLNQENLAPHNALSNAQPYFVPILNWDTAKNLETTSQLNLSNWKEWQPVSPAGQCKIGKGAFALESRPSMYPRFPQGTIFIFDPDIAPTDGDIVLVKIKKDNELTLRELRIDPPEWQLYPTVSGSNVLQYSHENHKIIGVNLLTMMYNRRKCD